MFPLVLKIRMLIHFLQLFLYTVDLQIFEKKFFLRFLKKSSHYLKFHSLYLEKEFNFEFFCEKFLSKRSIGFFTSFKLITIH